MTQDPKSGTAWERSLSDYAYTNGIDRFGWAWEFLRRNAAYQQDVRCNRAGRPMAIPHVSGAKVFRLRRRFVTAEAWGLLCFEDYRRTANEAHVFWDARHVSSMIHCVARAANDNSDRAIELGSFAGRKAVLVVGGIEHVAITHLTSAARIACQGASLLVGKSALTFQIEGLNALAVQTEALHILQRLQRNIDLPEPNLSCHPSKYLHYLVALDGHLAGRSYRDIAIVLHGEDKIGEHWRDDNRGYKSKVRRAVAAGIALMNGGYRDLL